MQSRGCIPHWLPLPAGRSTCRFKSNLRSQAETPPQSSINPAGNSCSSLVLWICFLLTCSCWVLLPACLLDRRALSHHIPAPNSYLQTGMKPAPGLLGEKSNKLNSQPFHCKGKFSGLLIVLIALLRASSKLPVWLWAAGSRAGHSTSAAAPAASSLEVTPQC